MLTLKDVDGDEKLDRFDEDKDDDGVVEDTAGSTVEDVDLDGFADVNEDGCLGVDSDGDGQVDNPSELFCVLEPCRPEVDPFVDWQTFIGWASADLDAIGMPDRTLGGLDLFAVDAADEAKRRCGLVFGALKSCIDRSQQEALARELPEEVCDWFRCA